MDRSRSWERYQRLWRKDHWEHGRRSSSPHVHGNCRSRWSARSAAPLTPEPALRALANLLVGLTTARDSSGSVWSNPLLAGAVPSAGLGLGSSFPGVVPVPSVSAGTSALGGVPPVQGSSTTGTSGVGGPSQELSYERSPARGESRSCKSGARRRSPSPTRSSLAVPSPASSGAVEVEAGCLSPPRGPSGAVGDQQGVSDVCEHRPGPSGFSVRPHSSVMPGPSRWSLAGRFSPTPSCAGEDDRSGSVGSLDPEQDDSFALILSLIREFYDMEERAGIAPNRCKTSLAPVYGLQSESSPALHLPTSPLLESMLEDVNSALAKFIEDQTVHGFIPILSRWHRRYYRTSSSSIPGLYSVPPGLASITLERVSEMKKRSVSLSHSQVSSLETLRVTSWLLDWWLSTCWGFREHLSGEVRANFEQLMLSGPRALEFLGVQGVAALGNLVLSRRDSLLLDVRSLVPAEEVACLCQSPLPSSASLFPSPLLKTALVKMRAASSDALVQKTLHPPRIPKKSALVQGKASSPASSADRGGNTPVVPRSQQSSQSTPSSSSSPRGRLNKGHKGKASFSQATSRSGWSGGKRKGSGKRSV